MARSGQKVHLNQNSTDRLGLMARFHLVRPKDQLGQTGHSNHSHLVLQMAQKVHLGRLSRLGLNNMDRLVLMARCRLVGRSNQMVHSRQ